MRAICVAEIIAKEPANKRIGQEEEHTRNQEKEMQKKVKA